MAEPQRAPAWRWWWRALAAQLLVVVVVATFAPTLDAELIGWDDWAVLVDNPHYRGFAPENLRWMFTTYHAGHYQPVTWLTYAVDHAIWGMDPTGYHLTNVLLHALNTVLVFGLARLVLRRALPAGAGWWRVELAALVAALLFGVHPLRVESVAWATERRDLVSASFVLLTVLAWWRAASGAGRRRRWLLASLALYVVSMLAKIGGAPLPVVLLVLDAWPLRRLDLRALARGRATGASRRALLETIPYFAIALGFSIMTLIVQRDTWSVPIERHGLLARGAQAAYGLVFYVRKTLWPADLLPLYELHLPLDPLGPRFVMAGLVVIAGLSLGLWLAIVRRRPALLVASLCYAALVGPLLGLFQNGPQLVADRYTYLACLSWTILVAGAAATAWARAGRVHRAALIVAAVVASVALATATFRQCRVWRTTETFWAHMIEADPDSAFAQNGWGWILASRRRHDEAVAHFERALAIDPRQRNAWFNLWSSLRALDREAELGARAREGLDAPLLTVRAGAHAELARLAEDRGDHDAAIAAYLDAVAIHPDLIEERLALARLLVNAGRTTEARVQLDEILRREPEHPGARRLRSVLRSG